MQLCYSQVATVTVYNTCMHACAWAATLCSPHTHTVLLALHVVGCEACVQLSIAGYMDTAVAASRAAVIDVWAV